MYVQLREMFPTEERLRHVRMLVDLQRYTRRDLLTDLNDIEAAMRLVLK